MITSTDPIADMLTRIRNALNVGKTETSMPHSNAKEAVAKVLASTGFVSSAKVETEEGRKYLVIKLSQEGQNSPLTHLARLSRPGRRTYVNASRIPVVKRGRGVVVISTSQGVMSGTDAKAKKLGGELICEVY